MLNEPFAGRGLRVPECSRMLIATEDGVFLWPGTALVYRRGNGFFAAAPRDVNSALACFFGPAAIDLPLQNILERSRDELRCGRFEFVQQMLDGVRLPPILPNGMRLRRAIAERQGIAIPDLPIAERQDGTVWNESDIGFIAPLYDAVYANARRLEKIFNPAIGNLGGGWDPSKHPRHPAGESDGGEFAPTGEGDGSPIIPVAGPRPPWSRKRQKPLGPPPTVPKTEPIKQVAKFLALRTVAYWLIRAATLGSDIVAPEAVAAVTLAVEGATWLAPYVKQFFAGPQTLDQLQAAVKDPPAGTETHHIVEQTSAENAGFPRSQIDDPSNLVQIPTLKHWQLNSWFETSNGDYGGMTPRQYVKGKDWDTRMRVGLDGLRKIGVLK